MLDWKPDRSLQLDGHFGFTDTRFATPAATRQRYGPTMMVALPILKRGVVLQHEQADLDGCAIAGVRVTYRTLTPRAKLTRPEQNGIPDTVQDIMSYRALSVSCTYPIDIGFVVYT